MTALEQQLMKELQQEKDLNIKLISNLESQEVNFLQILEKQQELYESNLSKIVNNYKISIMEMEKNIDTYLEQNKKELESLKQGQALLYKQIKIMNESLINLPNLENLEESLKTLLYLQEK
jgi:DNA topoisomerase VI subunit B